ncbi:hypothetical protein SAMN05421874_15328 [Nonomuraea maritima]|uniref:Uncharacterized protein n=1 Tax=Nonomuraea maritima TaxID=683260 RepID=A0A1G9S904_9ACTN|nr:hypothetical protein [Nonomuraea maritima]SDM31797.1 hypothetical protein SAMN05421874_15328 [Nonomuraea maritima]
MTREQVEQALRRTEELTDQARRGLDRAAGLMAQNIWTGPAAQRFADDLTAQRQALFRACVDAVDELRRLLARTPADSPG